jgi:hypothetical protein
MLSHRAHNRTLELQGEATRLSSEANILHTNAADKWSYYQAKKIRQSNLEAMQDLVKTLPTGGSGGTMATPVRWQEKLDKWDGELKAQESEARALDENAKQLEEESGRKLDQGHHHHTQGDRFDLAELAVEIGLVLCTVALLASRALFWHLGIGAGVVGVIVAAAAFLLH